MDGLITYTTSGFLMLLSGVVPAVVAYWLLDDTHKPAVIWFQLLMVSITVWSVSFGIMVLVYSSEIRLIATHFYVLAVSTSSVFTFMFCYEYVHKRPISKYTYVLFVPPVMLFFFSWLNPLELIYTVENPYQYDSILIPAASGSIRPLVTVGLGYPLIIMGFGMVLGDFIHTTDNVRKIQSISVLLLIMVGTVLGLIKFLDVVPSHFDPTPIGWAITGSIFALAIKKYQFLQISPPPETRLIDSVSDMVYIYGPEKQ